MKNIHLAQSRAKIFFFSFFFLRSIHCDTGSIGDGDSRQSQFFSEGARKLSFSCCQSIAFYVMSEQNRHIMALMKVERKDHSLMQGEVEHPLSFVRALSLSPPSLSPSLSRNTVSFVTKVISPLKLKAF